MTNLDDILRRIAYWNGYDSAGEWERTGHEAKAQLEQYIANQVREARIEELEEVQGKLAEDTPSYIEDRVSELKVDEVIDRVHLTYYNRECPNRIHVFALMDDIETCVYCFVADNPPKGGDK